jgi:excinuclease ABC subunit C
MDYYRYQRDEYLKVPDEPGVYKYFNAQGTIIYVGKAKSLKKRVANYFTKTGQQNRKTARLVQEIAYIEITVVNTEFDALLLENGLIKENKPKYNILLKDDKTYPSILITKERFPKIYSTRNIDHNLGEYFGPFTSVKAMNSVIELVQKLFSVRTCNLALTKNNIEKKKFKVCLEYHLGNCKGPCENLQTEEEYLEEIDAARQIIKGNVSKLKSSYREKMQAAAEIMSYESAQQYKEKLSLLEKFQNKSTIVNPSLTNIDVVTIVQNLPYSYVNYLRIIDGTIKVSDTFEVNSKMGETTSEILEYVIPAMQSKFHSSSRNILSNVPLTIWNDTRVDVPEIGDKKKLIDLSIKNALVFKREREELRRTSNQRSSRIVETLQKDLHLKEPPVHIECFDNSNIQGSNPVASMVCFKNGKPSKKDYRKFNIKTVVGPDDFGSMKEIIFRRYSRLKKEQKELPQLIVIDGGKGQLNAATESLRELDLYGRIPVIGIAKRLEEIYYPEDPLPLFISKKSESLKVLQHLRDEAHRFAITFHRTKRSKNAITSSLDQIKGIGQITKNQLLMAFGSVSRIENADISQIEQVVGKKKAKLIKDFYAQKKES